MVTGKVIIIVLAIVIFNENADAGKYVMFYVLKTIWNI